MSEFWKMNSARVGLYPEAKFSKIGYYCCMIGNGLSPVVLLIFIYLKQTNKHKQQQNNNNKKIANKPIWVFRAEFI